MDGETFEIDMSRSEDACLWDLKVIYDDMLPDTFAEGGEVVLTGELEPSATVFRASEMTAKCPSKYEEQPGAPAKT